MKNLNHFFERTLNSVAIFNRKFIGACVSIVVVGCASTPPVIDLSTSVYRASSDTISARKTVARIDIRNKADDGRMINTALGSDSIFPIKPATTTKATVEADLGSFFSQAMIIENSAARSLSITIGKADSYWVWSSAAKIPFVGIALAGADTEFGMNVRVLFEVEESGKVVSSYLFDEIVTVQDKATTQEDISMSYQHLVAEYRKKLFGEIESRFFQRYF